MFRFKTLVIAIATWGLLMAATYTCYATGQDDFVVMDQTGRYGVLKNDGSVGLEFKYSSVLFREGWILVGEYHNNKKISGMKDIDVFSFLCITNTADKIALFDKNLRQITEYKFDGWTNMAPYWSGQAIGEKDTYIDIRTMHVVSGPHSKDSDWQ